MPTQFIPLIPILLTFCFILYALGLKIVTQKKLKKGRRNPLTKDLLRNPGESLRQQVAELDFDLAGDYFGLIFLPCSCFLTLVSQGIAQSKEITISSIIVVTVVAGVAVVYLSHRIISHIHKRNNLRLGLECELAVGEELTQLMLLGCRVFHDFPGENFNIDHVIIGPNGVFAVETKGRAKPDKGRGKEDVRVVYNGKSLQFPGWTETEPIVQAKRQAQWLANWLKDVVGQPVPVKPALALPGWFIDRQGRDMVVFNSKKPEFLATPRGERVLSDEMIQRAAYQVEQRCRTVEPLSFCKVKGE